uniref:Natterin-3 n=1 Tax=Amphiprion ocellaris TaxID=80972 RepID=A0AAQ5YNB8_AMPOC
ACFPTSSVHFPHFLTLLLLLILSSVGLQKSQNSQDGNVSSPSPDLEHKVPEIPANISVFTSRRFLESSRASRHIRDAEGNVDHGKLKWKGRWWFNDLPDGAFSIFNDYTERTEVLCKFECRSGTYIPSEHSGLAVGCTNDGKWGTNYAEYLVNEDDFEILEWKDGYYGSVPQNSVRICEDEEIYVGKNKYGLGKVDPKQKCFFLPWGGSEYWYRSYQVLAINKDVESNFMTDIRYHIDDAKIVSYPPETMRTSVVTNYECNQVSKSATLTKTTQEQKRWDLSSSITLGVKTEFKVGIPRIVEGRVEVSTETTFQASGGHSMTEEISHSVSVNIDVPPNHSCTVRMVGHKYKTDIPFTARFRRTYRNGKTKWTSISAKYDSIAVGEVHVVVDRCTPVGNATPCPQRTS